MIIINRIVREPAALISLVTLLLAAGGVFGWWTLTNDQFNWVLGFLGAAILVLRAYVTPTGSPALPEGQTVTLPSGSTGIVVPLAEKPA